MMGQVDTSHRPAYAVTLWCDDNHIYVELPMAAGGTPYIQKYPNNSMGLQAAMHVLQTRRKEVLTPTREQPANYTLPAQPMVKTLTKAQKVLYSETTESQRASALRVLEKLGLKPR